MSDRPKFLKKLLQVLFSLVGGFVGLLVGGFLALALGVRLAGGGHGFDAGVILCMGVGCVGGLLGGVTLGLRLGRFFARENR